VICPTCGESVRKRRADAHSRAHRGPAPRFPFAPLAQHLSAFTEEGTTFTELRCGYAQAARVLGFSDRQVYRWRTAGLSERAADRVAVALGVHPSAIWGELWWSSASPLERSDDEMVTP